MIITFSNHTTRQPSIQWNNEAFISSQLAFAHFTKTLWHVYLWHKLRSLYYYLKSPTQDQNSIKLYKKSGELSVVEVQMYQAFANEFCPFDLKVQLLLPKICRGVNIVHVIISVINAAENLWLYLVNINTDNGMNGNCETQYYFISSFICTQSKYPSKSRPTFLMQMSKMSIFKRSRASRHNYVLRTADICMTILSFFWRGVRTSK